MKYHALGKYTSLNMIPAFLGTFAASSKGHYFLNDFITSGFVTGQSLNACEREFFDLGSEYIKAMSFPPYDHEMISFFCDPNYVSYNDHYNILKGPNSLILRCLYKRQIIEYKLEYTMKFFQAYNNDAKFFRLNILDGHEGSGELIKYSDDKIFNFLVNFELAGFLKDTIMIVHTDHGNVMMGPHLLMQTRDWINDNFLPALFVVLPKTLESFEEIKANLKDGENKLISPFTIYNSLLYIISDQRPNINAYVKDNENIFSGLSGGRTCDEFYNQWFFSDVDFKNEFCRCKAGDKPNPNF
jgi:hypothetical protein